MPRGLGRLELMEDLVGPRERPHRSGDVRQHDLLDVAPTATGNDGRQRPFGAVWPEERPDDGLPFALKLHTLFHGGHPSDLVHGQSTSGRISNAADCAGVHSRTAFSLDHGCSPRRATPDWLQRTLRDYSL